MNRIQCQFCSKLITEGAIPRHQKSCYLNPLNLKLCDVCNAPCRNKERQTCSYACSNKKFRTGENHGNWKQEAYRSTCFAYHKKQCVVCDESNIVQVHHMDENKNNNAPANLIPLCPTHHQYWHSRYRQLIQATVNEYVRNWSGRLDLNQRISCFQGKRERPDFPTPR
jgi:hypothetical protein